MNGNRSVAVSLLFSIPAAFSVALGAVEDEPGILLPAKSPNEAYVLRALEEQEQKENDSESFGGFATATGAQVLKASGEDVVHMNLLRVVWSEDSKAVALNYRAGGRYYPTSLYSWT